MGSKEKKKHTYLSPGLNADAKFTTFIFTFFAMVSAYSLYDVNNKTFPKRPDDSINFAKIVKFEKLTKFNWSSRRILHYLYQRLSE